MTDITNTELEGDATGNVATEVEAPAATHEAKPEASEPKSVSLDDAINQALEKHTPKADTAPTKIEAPAPAVTPEVAQAVDPVTGRVVEAIKAPASLTPALREKWGSIDPQFQKYIVDRDRDINNRLTETANERKLAAEFKEVVTPYEAMLRQYGTNGVAHAKELFNMSHGLHTGSPQQKAQIIHSLIMHFQPDANTLMALAGGQQPAPTPAPKPVNVQDEVQRVLSEREQAAQEAQFTAAHDAFASDPKNEFFGDVRQLMGKAIEAGFVDGNDYHELLKNAYDFACQQHPEVKEVLASRAQAAAAPSQAQATPAKQPVPSVKPSLGGGRSSKAPAKSMSLDEAIATAMKQHGVA